MSALPIRVRYDELSDPNLTEQVQDKLVKAFGESHEDALGLVIVDGLPRSFVTWRERCLCVCVVLLFFVHLIYLIEA